MSRGVGLTEAANAVLPPEVVALLALATHLGDPPVLIAVGAIAYWVWDRDRGAALLSLAVGALAVVVGLKALFSLPRPPLALHAIPADGFGFPSGHALGAAAVLGGIAVYTDVGTRTQRVGLMGSLIALVAVSRVGLGVHYSVDVIAGVIAGLGFLGLHRWARDNDGTTGFSLAVIAGIAGVLLAGPTRDSLALLGLAVGGFVALTIVPRPPIFRRSRDLPAMAVALPVTAGLGIAASGPWIPIAAVPVAAGALTAGILGLPSLAHRIQGGLEADDTRKRSERR